MSSVFFPWRKDADKNRRNSKCQERTFCQWAHHIMRGRQKHSYHTGRPKCLSADLLCRRSAMACTDMGRERIDVHNISTSQVLSNVCFLMQMTASWKLCGTTLFSYPLFQASQCWHNFSPRLTNTTSIKFTSNLKPYKRYLKTKENL